MHNLAILSILALAACGGQPAESRAPAPPATAPAPPDQGPAAPAGDCGEAALAMATLFGDDVLSRAPKANRGEWRIRFHDLIAEICSEDRWTREATSCIAAAKDSLALDACSYHLSQDGSDRLIEQIEAFVATIPAATSGPGLAGTSTTGIEDCDRYVAAVERYLACDSVPAGAADAIRQGLDAMIEGFKELHDAPEEARHAAADACRQGLQALTESARALGCAS
jgi:hypothetical protein